MEILKGALIAGLWGYLISLILAIILMMFMISQADMSDRNVAVVFVGGTLGMSFKIGAFLVPVAVVLGLVYLIIRRAVRQGVKEGVSAAPDS